jgi:O-acetyl-ADP-ribose deacetylase (regulator of RNase III)
LAEEREARTISFPSISTGVYGYPVREAAPIALRAVIEHLERPDSGVREVLFVLFDQGTHDAYVAALNGIRGTR